jgi:hypothetical protein
MGQLLKLIEQLKRSVEVARGNLTAAGEKPLKCKSNNPLTRSEDSGW